MRQRAFATVMNLAARKDADPKAVARLIKYIDAGIAQGGDVAAAWRRTKFQLLVALDRPDDLERELRDWIRDDVTTAPWRKYLALLVAERGKLDEAIQILEACEKDHLLAAGEYRTLATWYQTQNRREAYERARLESYKKMPEQYLELASSTRPLQTAGTATTTSRCRPSWTRTRCWPSRRCSRNRPIRATTFIELRDLYAACHDFRLLQMAPDALLGRSPEQIYPFLEQLNDNLLFEMRNESTADEIVARIKKLREEKRTPTDLRALDLFEAFVERRSAEVQNQRGPHVEACLAAMRRAFERKWSAGEPRLMAELSCESRPLPDSKSCKTSSSRDCGELQGNRVPADSRDHLQITSELCHLLYWAYDRKPEGMQMLAAEIAGYEQAKRGQWPFEDDDVFDSYVDMLQDSKPVREWRDRLATAFAASGQRCEQRKCFEGRLWQLYNHALANDGEVSLGKGKSLFDALLAYGLKRIDAAADENLRQAEVSRLLQTFAIAHNNQMPGVAEAARASSPSSNFRKFSSGNNRNIAKHGHGDSGRS